MRKVANLLQLWVPMAAVNMLWIVLPHFRESNALSQLFTVVSYVIPVTAPGVVILAPLFPFAVDLDGPPRFPEKAILVITLASLAEFATVVAYLIYFVDLPFGPW